MEETKEWGYSIKKGDSLSWVPYKEVQIWEQLKKEMDDKFVRHVLWGEPFPERTEDQKFKDRLKWAWINTNGTEKDKKLTWVHNETMKAYENENYEIKKPYEEIPYKEFIRWATSFDL